MRPTDVNLTGRLQAFLADPRRSVPFPGPFGLADFVSGSPLTGGQHLAQGSGESCRRKRGRELKPDSRELRTDHYVVGCRTDGSSWLLPAVEGDSADDQNIEAAQHFLSLTEAVSAAIRFEANVFELVLDPHGRLTVVELLVDLDHVQSVPYEGCYFLTDGLLAGSNPIGRNRDVTAQRIEGLRRAGVRCVVSLLSREELFAFGDDDDECLEDFEHHLFPIRDGEVPTVATMRLILNIIDQSVLRKEAVFVHCWGGRGRTGLVAACFIARHGIAVGQAALNLIARKRFEVGLFAPAPETPVQLKFARNWKEGD